MLIEAAKGGHTSVVQLLLDYPHSIMTNSSPNATSSLLLSQAQGSPQQNQIVTQPTQQPTQTHQNAELNQNQVNLPKHNSQKSLLRKNRSSGNVSDVTLTSAEVQQIRNQPSRTTTANEDTNILDKSHGNFLSLPEPNITLQSPSSTNSPPSNESRKSSRHEQILHKQQILEELQVNF